MLSLGQSRLEKLTFRHHLAAWFVRLVKLVFGFLGPRITFWIFRRLIGPILPKPKNLALIQRNVDTAYPEESAQRRAEIVDGVVASLPLSMADFVLQGYWRGRTQQWTRHNLDADWVQPYVQNEKQALFIMGHFAGWEVGMVTLTGMLKNVSAIYAAPKNPLLEKHFHEGRLDKGSTWTLFPRDLPGAQLRMVRGFAKGRSLYYTLDVPLPGPMLPFMGQTSPTTLTPYKLAAESGVPLIPLKSGRNPDGPGYWIEAQEPMFATDSSEAGILDLATRMNHVYTDWIRERPDQWYWTSNFFVPNPIWEAQQTKVKAAASRRSSS